MTMMDRPGKPTRIEVHFKGGLGRKYGSASEADREFLQKRLEIWLAELGYTWIADDLSVSLIEYGMD